MRQHFGDWLECWIITKRSGTQTLPRQAQKMKHLTVWGLPPSKALIFFLVILLSLTGPSLSCFWGSGNSGDTAGSSANRPGNPGYRKIFMDNIMDAVFNFVARYFH